MRPQKPNPPNPSPLLFADCCGRYLNDFAATPAPDAESLMRSRYSTFVLGRLDYPLATWHASTRPADLTFDTTAKCLKQAVHSHCVLDGFPLSSLSRSCDVDRLSLPT